MRRIQTHSCVRQFFGSRGATVNYSDHSSHRLFSDDCQSRSDKTAKVIVYNDDADWWKREVWTIPNMMTFTRIGGTPGVCYAIAIGEYQIAFYGLAFCGFLDWADGFVARLTKTESTLGK